MTKMTAAQVVATFLKKMGTERYYFYNGHSNWGLLDALEYHAEVKGIRTRHEVQAIHAADMDWRLRRHGPIPVTCTTVGPGNFNTIPGIAEAFFDSTPMLCLMGGGPTKWHGRGGIQEVYRYGDDEFVQMLKPITKMAVMTIRPDTVLDTLIRAYKTAITGRPGPVVMYMPLDVQNTEVDVNITEYHVRQVQVAKPAPDPSALREAAALIGEAERPVVYCSSGVHNSGAWEELLAFSEKTGIPVATTFGGKGSIPENHPLSLGVSNRSGTGQAVNATNHADLIIGVGVRFNDLNTAGWNFFDIPNTQKLIHIDIDPSEIGRIYSADVAIVSDAGLGLRGLVETLDTEGIVSRDYSEWLGQIETWRREWNQEVEPLVTSDIAPMEYARIVKDASDVINDFDPMTSITSDAGFIMNYIPAFYELRHPYIGHNTQQFGQMGFTPPALIANGLARPEHPMVSFCGDQAYLHCATALATCTEYGFSGVIVVFDNKTIQAEVEGARRRFGRGVGDHYRIEKTGEPWNPDLDRLGEAMGARVWRVRKPEEFKPALKEALESGSLCQINVDSATDVTRYAVPAVVKEGTIPFPYDWSDLTPLMGR